MRHTVEIDAGLQQCFDDDPKMSLRHRLLLVLEFARVRLDGGSVIKDVRIVEASDAR